jgi:hypothetical protein
MRRDKEDANDFFIAVIHILALSSHSRKKEIDR